MQQHRAVMQVNWVLLSHRIILPTVGICHVLDRLLLGEVQLLAATAM